MARPAAAPDSRLGATREAVAAALAEIIDRGLAGAPAEIAAPIRYAVLAPGKRIRPLLVVAAFRTGPRAAGASPGGPAPAVRLACVVELVHAYSLIHDDLPCMDDDELRRGRPTVHVQFGVREAILAGAALMPMAMGLLHESARELGLADGVAARLMRILAEASGGAGMVGGQLLDLRAEGRRVELEELERIHLGKTARLIEASCVMGGTAAGADARILGRLGRFGRALGLAFQVVDDILDVTGTAQSMGKAGGRDEALGKATYPGLAGLDGARSRSRDLLRGALDELEPVPRADELREIARWVVDRDR